ncbi:BON domain-containing protein [Herbaspirillum sp. SJZ107]|uniref:BON domain-containing protein n=1 Tax=Herbaspirillum sp. SJZ107 TaxID=2572881 RepID=UPI00114EE0E1|nr:BON domain-containing protein [Herbaspirillum sp. SJZ107]TQK07383.1 BON domain-containing protein [Herbaspirillum sp. SJZ107]
MKLLIATLLATAAGASFAAPTFALNHDPATYRNATQKAAADYRDAIAKCDTMSGNGKDVCVAEAKLARTQTEAKALSKYSNSPASREKARTNLAEAEFTLAKARCDGKSGAEKDDCMNNAKSVHTAALADAKAGRSSSPAGTVAPVATAAAIDKCAQAAGDTKTACVIETKPSAVREDAAAAANRTANAADNAGDKARDATADAAAKTREAAATAAEKTKAVAATAADKTKEVAQAAVDKTKAVASSVAQKTEGATAVAADKTKDASAEAADKTKDATAKTRVALADTAITTKVKAGLVKEPDLESLGIHVETEKGVVMLSGFVNSKSEADKAVKVAKGIDGVTNVKSAIQVK